ncbi:hypothetical protein QOZ91_001961 [Clostridium sardiniense]|nr:MetS family NSS transporter small subunit [Clostridium sardiniense]MDQ0460438.1 hypothetical protein [Clostridium sardiniense]
MKIIYQNNIGFNLVKGGNVFMTTAALVLFALGSTVLWGGLILTIGIFFHNEKKDREELV